MPIINPRQRLLPFSGPCFPFLIPLLLPFSYPFSTKAAAVADWLPPFAEGCTFRRDRRVLIRWASSGTVGHSQAWWQERKWFRGKWAQRASFSLFLLLLLLLPHLRRTLHSLELYPTIHVHVDGNEIHSLLHLPLSVWPSSSSISLLSEKESSKKRCGSWSEDETWTYWFPFTRLCPCLWANRCFILHPHRFIVDFPQKWSDPSFIR